MKIGDRVTDSFGNPAIIKNMDGERAYIEGKFNRSGATFRETVGVKHLKRV